MHSELRARDAFRLTGLRAKGPSAPAGLRQLRPALAARLRHLAALRYDFPVVLGSEKGADIALPITALFDRIVLDVAETGADGERLRAAVLRLEREIRGLVARGATGSLQNFWEIAAARLAAQGAKSLEADLARARAVLRADGDVVDCDLLFPRRFVLHAWKAAQKDKAARFRKEVERLIAGLSAILAADEARSPEGRSADRLRGTMGSVHRDTFDFEAMAQLLARSPVGRPLTDARRKRVGTLLVALESQRFFLDDSGHTFVYEECAAALEAFRARYDGVRALARALAMARLEVAGEYDEARHDALFEQLREGALAPEELATFPDYLVTLCDDDLKGGGRADLLELLCSGVPAKVLLQSDDLLQDVAGAEGLAAVGARARAFAGAAVGLNDVSVVQAPASHLPRMHAAIARAFAYPGAALVSIFSGVTGDTASLPPYLNAAAALESRAFPVFTCDPSKEPGKGRFCLEGNPQPERDWPTHPFDYEDAKHQRVQDELAFTLADFVAADDRFARHFLRDTAPAGKSLAVADWIERGPDPAGEAAPVVSMVDDSDTLRELVVDEAVLREARRCRDAWRRLRWLAASHAPAPIAAAVAAEVVAPAAESAKVSAPAAAPAPAMAPAAAPASDDPYIETPRCTTCNECTQLNNKMFAYDANKQAYIADPSAGTYRQLIEAAESCQVSIIHPGKPRDPQEAGLEELIARAEPFR